MYTRRRPAAGSAAFFVGHIPFAHIEHAQNSFKPPLTTLRIGAKVSDSD